MSEALRKRAVHYTDPTGNLLSELGGRNTHWTACGLHRDQPGGVPDITGEAGAVTCGNCQRVMAVPAEQEMAITFRQLDYWVRQGYLRPAAPLPGSGYAREWPAAEIEIGRRMGRLVRAGLPVEWSARFARDNWPSGEIGPGIRIEVDP
jgi:hypothetical protein